ncbi:unnamed protein product [Cylicostephanus goldi]|uniref:Phospholipase A2 domain-containing protein n=1 Tax=Cylicostephanus goldi TaxID=71465 RepID=A0A3P7LRT1_CYLGO|nr:unnamed protein product [Cylicostephanus goldi]
MLNAGYQIILVTFVRVAAAVYGQPEFSDWHCGSSEFTRRMSYESVGESCSELMYNSSFSFNVSLSMRLKITPLFARLSYNHTSGTLPVNHCCVVHDDCYALQLGQEKCDEDFCECNRLATITRNDCKDLLEATCSLVQLFGFGPYHNSINYTEPADLMKYTVNADSLRMPYTNLYAHCPKVNGMSLMFYLA